MKKIKLGMYGHAGLGGTPLCRLKAKDSAALVRAAAEGGVRIFHAPDFDAAKRMALGLAGRARESYALAVTVSSADELEKYFSIFDTDRIELALIDIDGGFESKGFDDLRASGRIGELGAETRSLHAVRRSTAIGWVDAVAMPLNCLASDEEMTAAAEVTKSGVELIALEPLAGGLWRSTDSAMAFLKDLGALPLFGVQYMWQLEQLLPAMLAPPALSDELWRVIHTERSEHAAEYCRGCGECLPCPASVDIPLAARMGQFMLSCAVEPLISAETERRMRLVRRCVGCGRCADRCRYHLPVRALIQRNLEDYREFLREHGGLE